MPARSGSTYYIPGKGTVNTKRKTFTGRGKGPTGTRKIREPTAASTPTTTISTGGQVTVSGYGSRAAERRAKRRSRKSRQRVAALNLSRQGAAQRRSRAAQSEARIKRTEAAVKAHRESKPERLASFTAPTAAKKAHRAQVRAKAIIAAPLPGLGPKESRNAQIVLREGFKGGATKKELLAAAETGLVESGFRNLPSSRSDGSSAGWRQETAQPQYGSEARRRRPGPTARDYFSETASAGRGVGMTAGQLAQSVQRSDYPERYDERKGEAVPIVKGFLRKARVAKEAGLPLKATGNVPKQVMSRFKAARQAAKELERAKLPYVWGGGHGSPKAEPTGGGLDCSGAVSYVLNKMGVLKGSLVSGDMGSVLKPGPGAVTVFYNAGHTFMRIGNRYFGTSRTNPAGGAGFIEGSPDLSGYSVGHVPGLGKKVAVALGVSMSFPGMTLSPSGTSATITSGATVEGPGFSSKPITPRQRYWRTMRKLKRLGAGMGEAPTQTTSTTLAALERKYGVKSR